MDEYVLVSDTFRYEDDGTKWVGLVYMYYPTNEKVIVWSKCGTE